MHVCRCASPFLSLSLYIVNFSSAGARYDIKTILLWSKAGLNSEFFFSQASYLTKVKEPSRPYYSRIVGGIYAFATNANSLDRMLNANNRICFLLRLPLR